MRAIIKGSVYDTDRSRVIATWESGTPGTDCHMKETIFSSPTGGLFLYSTLQLRSWRFPRRQCAEEVIEAISRAEARAWAEDRLGKNHPCLSIAEA